MTPARTPDLTARAVEAATAAYAADPAPADVAAVEARLAALARTAARPPAADLAAWARELAGPAGAVGGFPLLGTGLRAETGAALLWCGARLARDGGDTGTPALLAGLAAGSAAGLATADLARGLAADRAVTDVVAGTAPQPVARPTTAALGAAACAALLSGVRDLAAVLDTAASLMVLTPGVELAGSAAAAPLWAGHAASAGWLAALLPATGVTPLPGALAVTLAAAAGPDADPLPDLPADLRGVLAALS